MNFKAHAIVPKMPFNETLKQKQYGLPYFSSASKVFTVKHFSDILQGSCIEKQYLFG
jgi:hypothetical protein